MIGKRKTLTSQKFHREKNKGEFFSNTPKKSNSPPRELRGDAVKFRNFFKKVPQ